MVLCYGEGKRGHFLASHWPCGGVFFMRICHLLGFLKNSKTSISMGFKRLIFKKWLFFGNFWNCQLEMRFVSLPRTTFVCVHFLILYFCLLFLESSLFILSCLVLSLSPGTCRSLKGANSTSRCHMASFTGVFRFFFFLGSFAFNFLNNLSLFCLLIN